MNKKQEGVHLGGKRVSDSDMTDTVIKLQAQLQAVKRERNNLKKDRDETLEQHQDLRKSIFPTLPEGKPRQRRKGDIIRLCAGDIHGMRMDKAAVGAFLQDVEAWRPDEVIIGGDLVECGGWLAKHQPVGFVAYSDYSYQQDIVAANWFLDELQSRAPGAKIFYIEGNHEDRVERWIVDQVASAQRDGEFLEKLISPRILLRLEERGIQYFRRGENYVKGAPNGWIKLGKVFYTHTLGTGKNAARDAAEKAGGNVVYFCTHRPDASTPNKPGIGAYSAYNPGCLCELQPMWMNSRTTDWSHGYGVEFVAENEEFLHINIPIIEGRSLVGPLLSMVTDK